MNLLGFEDEQYLMFFHLQLGSNSLVFFDSYKIIIKIIGDKNWVGISSSSFNTNLCGSEGFLLLMIHKSCIVFQIRSEWFLAAAI